MTTNLTEVVKTTELSKAETNESEAESNAILS
jgi:hypothetical protein